DDLAHGAGGRPRPARLVPLQNPLQLPWTPAHVRLAQLQHCLLKPHSRLVGVTVWSPVQLHQPGHPRLPVSSEPNIAGLSRDLEAGAKFPHRLLIPLILKDKPKLLVHRTARFPGHDDVLPPPRLVRQCQICPRLVLSAMSPVRTRSVPPTPHSPYGVKRSVFNDLLRHQYT